ncbi:hypothetical protein [uncultured Campylobacter sp.]|uniref:hypothetical protein n=1 Tax=uncultured Campylobacter sp. TaxID=218934 RepID=UPI00260A014E|nr:hypothetical protein [uncultured Campylobacter sp.]
MKLNEKIEIYNGDCLKVLDELYQSNIKVDLILTDLPYGRTQNHWDNIIPFDLMWNKILKVIKRLLFQFPWERLPTKFT